MSEADKEKPTNSIFNWERCSRWKWKSVGCCLFIILGVPFSESTQTFTDADLRREAIITFQCLGIRIGYGYIPGLHTDEFTMDLEVVILRQHLCSHKFLLERADIVKQILRLSAADVVGIDGFRHWCAAPDGVGHVLADVGQ